MMFPISEHRRLFFVQYGEGTGKSTIRLTLVLLLITCSFLRPGPSLCLLTGWMKQGRTKQPIAEMPNQDKPHPSIRHSMRSYQYHATEF